jgi:glycosyltransferase involved in cell wall biosynthesis
MGTPIGVLEVVQFAQAQYAKMIDSRSGKHGIVMLSDNDGCGYWRMRLPTRSMKMDGWYADITSAMVKYEQLLEYETIFVQRFHEWDAFYVLERLKKAGKRIVYDIDDDLFSIPKDNPAANVIRKDQQFAALETMRLADTVIVSTVVLKERLSQMAELAQKIVVVPNALDLRGWTPTPLCGSPDGKRRIFWQGGSTHAEDWTVCIEAVEDVMMENDDVVLMILGFLPPVVLSMVQRNHWQSRVEYMGFSEPETYYQLVKGVRAEVGLAPLTCSRFNDCKSNLKLLENSFIGMPTVASKVAPYLEIDGSNGILVETKDDWYNALSMLLGNATKRREMLVAARRLVSEKYDIEKVAEKWASVLCV